ncbi:DUF411 domain-containing protein [uncultured Albimonas sp.]|uniref:DUF411 domain-containing protein n=1 Tax=uncultured Albimonas sp. TaxID=1331701 RepID=UPI0030EEAD86|tara:strand:+ start:9047 stop:9532 length:486 start_codon:yes stop_codon:yes gene_type:complete
MTATRLSRRRVLHAGALGLLAAALGPAARALAVPQAMQVLKDPACGCCEAWVEILRAAGFEIAVETLGPAALMRRKIALGVPQAAVSCHTGLVEGYVVEGHVPAQDIRRLLAERPDAVGLAVPGMPWGSPGMGPETEREAFDVLLIGRDGGLSPWTRYPAA